MRGGDLDSQGAIVQVRAGMVQADCNKDQGTVYKWSEVCGPSGEFSAHRCMRWNQMYALEP